MAKNTKKSQRLILLGLVLAIILAVFLSSSWPKDRFQKARERILKNPQDFEAHLVLAEELLNNNQLPEAEKELLAAKRAEQTRLRQGYGGQADKVQILGLTSQLQDLINLWQDKNPEEIKKNIAKWEKIVVETPSYRDGYLFLTYYYYKLGQNDQAEKNLQKALELDPNFEPAKELETIIK